MHKLRLHTHALPNSTTATLMLMVPPLLCPYSVQDALAAEGGRPAALLDGTWLPAPVLGPMWQEQQQQWWAGVLGQYLKPEELAALAQLSVFPSVFCLDGALTVAPSLMPMAGKGQLLQSLQDLTVVKPAGEFRVRVAAARPSRQLVCM